MRCSISAKSAASTPPGARADGDHSGPVVVLAVEQRGDLELAQVLLDGGELDLGLLGTLGVVALVGELHEHLEVVDPTLQAFDASQFALPVAEGAGDFLRGIRVVPEILRARLLAELGDLGLELVDADHRPDVAEGLAERCDLVAEVEVDHGRSSLSKPAWAPAEQSAMPSLSPSGAHHVTSTSVRMSPWR
jgi:hypothetical protein